MSIPVIICDDSSFARKQISQALPRGWDIEVTFAGNGREGIAALEAGQGDILFLDLTMPEVDGFDVLEYIRAHDINTLPIVVSGDIQPESRARVMGLGAVAFINKPVDASQLCSVLEEYGVLGVLDAAIAPPEVQVGFHDWLQEIANVAMGRAADLLTHLIDDPVELTIPRVFAMDSEAVNSALAGANGHGIVSVIQGFIGSGVAGEALLQLDEQYLDAAAALMKSREEEGDAKLGALVDITNVLLGAFLRGIADQLHMHFSLGHPRARLHGEGLPLKARSDTSELLCIELSYLIGDQRLRCEQRVMISAASIAALKERAELAMDIEA